MAVEPGTVVESIFGRCLGAASVTARTPIPYDPYLPGRSVDRIFGIAEVGADSPAAWSAIVKRTTGPGLRAAKRELAAYRDGVTGGENASGLRAPALLAWDEGEDHVELWLEVLQDEYDGIWPAARFGIAARHIGEWDALTSLAPPVPGFDSEDAWAERHGQPHRLGEAIEELRSFRNAAAAEDLMRLLDDDGFHRTEALITGTELRIERLATFPRTLLHHDLVRSNLFALTPSTTGAIDWENVGRAPFGVDLAPLVGGSVRRGEASGDELARLEELVLSNYEDALREAGIGHSTVRPAYRLALGLRWHVVLGTIRSWLDPASIRMRGSRPEEPRAESLRHLIALSRHLLERGNVTI
jgi:hypothetical protein